MERERGKWTLVVWWADFMDEEAIKLFALAMLSRLPPPAPRQLFDNHEWSRIGFPETMARDDPLGFVRRFRALAAPLWRTWNFKGYNPDVRLATVLSMLAHPGNYTTHGNVTGVGASTCVGWLRLVCESIHENFADLIRMPRPGTREEAQVFAQFADTPFHRAKGIVDSSQIRLHQKPAGAHDPDPCCYRKKVWTVHLQAIVDRHGRFLNVFIGTPGAAHDAAVFQMCHIYQHHEQFFQDSYIIADKAYPMLPFCLPMIKSPTTQREHDFNEEASQVLGGVEQAFGRLKQRWRMLMDLDVDLSFVKEVIMSCCIMETLCYDEGVEYVHDPADDAFPVPQDPDRLPPDHRLQMPLTLPPRSQLLDGLALRRNVLHRFEPSPPAPAPAPAPAPMLQNPRNRNFMPNPAVPNPILPPVAPLGGNDWCHAIHVEAPAIVVAVHPNPVEELPENMKNPIDGAQTEEEEVEAGMMETEIIHLNGWNDSSSDSSAPVIEPMDVDENHAAAHATTGPEDAVEDPIHVEPLVADAGVPPPLPRTRRNVERVNYRQFVNRRR